MKSILLLSLLFAVANAQLTGVYSLSMTSPNYVNIFTFNGTNLAFVSQVATGGNGTGGQGLQSQGSITVYGNYLFAVNPTSNSVSLFSISTTDATAVTLIGTAPSGGDWPLSVTARGTIACVTNSGVNNGLRCFTFSSTAITPIAGSDRSFGLTLTTPPVSHTGPAQISFTKDGTGIVVSIKGANPPILLWSISNGVPSANPVNSTQLGNVPFGFTFDTDGTMVLTDAAPVGTTGGIELVALNTATLSVTFLLPAFFLIPTQNAACWISWSPLTGHFYASNSASSSISEISRTGTTLAVVNTYQFAATKPLDTWVQTINGKDYLFAFSGTGKIVVFSLTPGSATILDTITIANSPNGFGVTAYTATAVPTSAAVSGTAISGTAASGTAAVSATKSGSAAIAPFFLLAIIIAAMLF